MARLHGLDQVGFAAKLLSHPAYDAFWQQQALDKLLVREPSSVPVMLVHSLWDQEDIYGNMAVYEALEAKGTGRSNLFLVIGPWFHHQQRLDGSALGPIHFGSDTAAYFRLHVLRPFLDHFLKDDAPALDVAPVTAFETGSNQWQALPEWPAGCPLGCTIESRALYLQPGRRLSFGTPAQGAPRFESYVSDPDKPVPYLPRPIHTEGPDGEKSWQTWLVSDQRDASGRPDVLTFVSDVLDQPLKIAGKPIVNLFASTTGTDGDFVVKLIDEYPPQMGRQAELGGYQLMIAADILRGRYRVAFDRPQPLTPNQAQLFKFELPTTNHVFLPGHRLIVQVQSSWFPVYDRNPQTFVKNIAFAAPEDFRAATIKIGTAGPVASRLDLPVVVPTATH
jgi:hypothetical protein